MDFSLSDEQRDLYESVVAFARNELNDDLERRDRDGEFSRELWVKTAQLGIHGLPFPVEYGGQGADVLTTAIAMEALGLGCQDNGLLFSINAHMWSAAMPISRFGTDNQKDTYLRGLCDGSLIGVQGMTEPGSGSDAFALQTTAVANGDEYVLNGSKTFITNAPVADVFVVFATLDPDKGWAGLCAFIVDRDTPGLTVSDAVAKMGLRTSPMGDLFFDDCRVPAANMLGAKGSGMMVFQHSIDWERSLILASTIGTVERQLELAIDYANEREQFGAPIGKNQAVSHRLVDIKVRLEAARLLLYRVAAKWDDGSVNSMDTAMVKLFLSECAVDAALESMKTFGGSGYLVESGIEREVRDVLASRIYSGTSDIQRSVIARYMGL